jgi:hypothetical protein
MNKNYFTDREFGPKPRNIEEIGLEAWGGIVSIIGILIKNGSFGLAFPDTCLDGGAIVGTNEQSMALSLRAEIPDLVQYKKMSSDPWVEDGELQPVRIDYWPLKASQKPSTNTILDLIEFCYRNVAKANQVDWHSYYRHHHLTFDQRDGQSQFREGINRVFSRNGLAFEQKPDGHIERLGPSVLRESLTNATFRTSDQILDKMLEDARSKFLSPKPDIRREALEKLWDAWERIKTLEDPNNKSLSITALLNKASPEPKFREALEREARELTAIGNQFQIRHSETSQTPLENLEHVDYLFHRLFAIIFMFLVKRKP